MTERRLPLAFGNSGTSTDADQNDLIQKGANGLWVTRGSAEVIIPGRFLTRVLHDVVGSFSHSLQARTTKFRVYGQGPGGGGGGADGQGSGTIGMGAPGSAGAFFDHIFTVAVGVTSFTYTVGQGGAGGSGLVDGAPGSAATQVTYNAVTVGGNPGLGGESENAANHPAPNFPHDLVDGGSVLGSPNFGVPGQRGSLGFSFDNAHGTTGKGGDSVLGYGGAQIFSITGVAVTLNGLAGVLGGGGSGGLVMSATANVGGGAGGDGILIVEEYS